MTCDVVLPSKAPIGYVDVRVFAHATEDVDKVLNAVHNILPAELLGNISFERTSLTGHHGNQIVLLETRIKDRNVTVAVFEKLSSGLSSLDKEQLSNELEQRLERGNLYIRLDKQSAYLGEFKFNPTDSVHFRFHFNKSKPEEVVAVCRQFGMLP